MTKNVTTLTVKEVIARTGFSRRLVMALLADGTLTGVRRPGRSSHIRIFESSVEALPDRMTVIAGGKRHAQADPDSELPPCDDAAFQ